MFSIKNASTVREDVKAAERVRVDGILDGVVPLEDCQILCAKWPKMNELLSRMLYNNDPSCARLGRTLYFDSL